MSGQERPRILHPGKSLQGRFGKIAELSCDALFKGTSYTYTIDPAVTGKVVEMKLAAVTAEQALYALAEAAHLTIGVEDGAYVIAPGPKGAEPFGHQP